MAVLDPAIALSAAQSPITQKIELKSNAVVFGAVGKVGEALLNSVIASPHYERVYVLTRKALDSSASRLSPLFCAGEDLPEINFSLATDLRADDMFCCLTSLRTFYRRDDVYHRVLPKHVLPLAHAALAMGAKRMVLVKPADTLSQMGGYGRYLSDGEELALVKLPFQTIVILRPQQDVTSVATAGFLQQLAHWTLSILGDYMTPARLRPRRAKTIASACLSTLEKCGTGVHIVGLDQLPTEDV